MNKKENFERLIRLGKHFIKALKTEGLYNQFLTKYGKSPNESRINNSNGAMFEAMMKDVVYLVKMDLHHKGKDLERINDDYEYYTNMLNMLLHKYVENGMHIRPERCANLGEKIFNSFCIETFGEEKFKKDMDDFNASRKMMLDDSFMNELREHYERLHKDGVNIPYEHLCKMFMDNKMNMKIEKKGNNNVLDKWWDSNMFYINDDNIQFDLETEQNDMPF